MTTPPMDNSQELLSYLQVWRQALEQSAAMSPGLAFPGAPPALPAMPPMPPTFAMPPAAATPPIAPSPLDYTHQLLSYLQAWRHYLEQATGAATGPPPPSSAPPNTPSSPPESPRRPTGDSLGSRTTVDPVAVSGPEPQQTAKVAVEPGVPFASSAEEFRSGSGSARLRPPDEAKGPGIKFGNFFDDLGRERRAGNVMRAAEGQAGPTGSPRTTPRLTGSPYTGPASVAGDGARVPVAPKSLYSKAIPQARTTTPWASGGPRGAVMSHDEADLPAKPETPEAPAVPKKNAPKKAKKAKDIPKRPGYDNAHQD